MITLFRAVDRRGRPTRANKLFKRASDGTVTKEGAVEGGRYLARTVDVPDLAAMRDFLREVGGHADFVLSLGLFRGLAPGEKLTVLPRSELEQHVGNAEGIHEVRGKRCAARLKVNMEPGPWLLLDRDIVPGMPEELADLSFEEWWSAMGELCPPLKGAGVAMLPSSSSRVLVDGTPYSNKPAWHALVRVREPSEIGRIWPQLQIKSFGINLPGTDVQLGFMRPCHSRAEPGKVVARRAWSIYDPTTASPERLVYDGAPTLEGEGLELLPVDVRVIEGPEVDLANIADLEPAEKASANRHGLRLDRNAGGQGVGVPHLVSATLRLDLEVELERGSTATIHDLWLEGERVRCQAPFRDSESMAAYVNFHADGTPFLFDVGAATKFTLEDPRGLAPEEVTAALKACEDADGVLRLARELGRALCRHERSKAICDTAAAELSGDLAGVLGLSPAKTRHALAGEMKKGFAEGRDWTSTGEDDALDRMNARFAVLDYGGKAVVAQPDGHDPAFDCPALRLYGLVDFKALFDREKIAVMTADGPRKVGIATWWLEQEDRRQCEGLVLKTDGEVDRRYLNMWKGFRVAPQVGEPSAFLEHVRMIAEANRDPDRVEAYLLDWLAFLVQAPSERPGTAIVLRGEEGTGKGAIGHVPRRMLGTAHTLYATRPDHLVGRFTGHLVDKVYVFADEAFFAGDPRQGDALKSLITDDTLAIEGKGLPIVQAPNRTSLIMATNHRWAVPAGPMARRYAVVDVPDHKIGDQAYFEHLWHALEDPGELGKLLRFLLERHVDRASLRHVPQTSALDEQKIASLPSEAAWLMEALERGCLTREVAAGFSWTPFASTAVLCWHYETYCRERSVRRQLNSVLLGRYLTSVFGQSTRPRGSEPNRPRGYEMGDLEEARAAFAKAHGLEVVDWGDPVEPLHKVFNRVLKMRSAG